MSFEFLRGSIGKKIQLERGGPDKVIGILDGIHSDYLVLRTEKQGVLYCVLQHLKSVTEAIIPVLETEQSDTEKDDTLCTPDIPVIEADNFHSLLEKMNYCLIRVNLGGPNAIQGVLIDVSPDSITLIHEMKDFVHYPIYHIRSISRIYQIESNDNKDENKNENKNDKSEKQQDKEKDYRNKDDQSRKHRSHRYSDHSR